MSLLEQQEALTKEILHLFDTPVYQDTGDRPKSNFIDIMNWVQDSFSKALKNRDNLNKYVHNRVIMDGQFMHFCKENGIIIECLYKDSIISWKTETDLEKFFVQGVFLIKKKNVEFLHAALFHKGNQNEDEVSFFVVVSNDNFDEYVKIRNQFDNWIQLRDRSNLRIRVIDGEDMPYSQDHSWEELFLPEKLKLEIKTLVENFLASKDFYLKNRIPWKRGVFFWGGPGNGKTSIIRTIIANYNFKPVTVVPSATDEAVREAFAYAEEQSPSLLYFEDLDSMLEGSVNPSSFLNLMDGISSKNGLLVIATANNVKRLQSNITDRPSRFDRKFEIPLPDQEMAYIYLKKWFGMFLSAKKCRELVKRTEKYDFSYAYLKELYISSMFEALSHNRKSPTEKDIENVLVRLIKDKMSLGIAKTINTEKYFS